MNWRERLNKEAIEIAKNYKGKLEFYATERLNTVSIQIFAGKRYDFEILKKDIENEKEE